MWLHSGCIGHRLLGQLSKSCHLVLFILTLRAYSLLPYTVFVYIHYMYKWPLTKGRVRDTNPLCNWKFACNFWSALCILKFSVYAIPHWQIQVMQIMQYCSIYYWKKSGCKWTCTVQTSVVQGQLYSSRADILVHKCMDQRVWCIACVNVLVMSLFEMVGGSIPS